MLILTGLTAPIRASAAEVATPEAAVTAFMDSVREWDAAAASAFLGDAVPGNYADILCNLVLAPTLEKLDYTLGNSRITGRSAVVDISVTAADLKGCAGDLLAEAAGCAALAKLTGLPIDVEQYVTGRMETYMHPDNLTTIRTDTSVYLLLGGDGAWSIDVTDLRNLRFLEALTGGMVALEEPIRALSSEIAGNVK
ncbi:hypothetical protein LJC63_06230 [Ruminococcaceae bacterium OttesenSCG-928-L11]|nr:hypothetical protein [Ruminococcaceae bacterium OttesenSCG-928-L11]